MKVVFILLVLIGIATALPMIIDTDADTDDMAALWYALRYPKADVRLITVAGNSWAHLAAGMTNVYNLLALLGRDDVAVAPGAQYAWRDEANHTHHQSDAIPDGGKNGWVGGGGRYEIDTLFGSAKDLPPTTRAWGVNDTGAVESIRQLLAGVTGNVTWLSLGGLTVFGQYLKTYPQDISRIDRLYIMGGAVNHPGNLFTVPTNPYAEFNIYVDPDAASFVVRSGVPVYLVPLDVTNSVDYTPDNYAKLTDPSVTPSWLATFLRRCRVSMALDDATFYSFMYPWDEFATAVALDPAVFAATHFTPRRITVVTTEGSELGRTKEDNVTGSWVLVGDATNPSVFWSSWFRVVKTAGDGDGEYSDGRTEAQKAKWGLASGLVFAAIVIIVVCFVWCHRKGNEPIPSALENRLISSSIDMTTLTKVHSPSPTEADTFKVM